MSTSYARARTHTCPLAYASARTLAARESRQNIPGGGCPCRLCPVRNVWRCAPFLTVLGTHCISRSFPLPPQCMLASLAAVSVVAGPASHAAAQSNTTRVRSILCGRPLSRAVPASIACGSRGILWKRLVVGRAAAAARRANSGVCWPPPTTRPGSRAQRRRSSTRASVMTAPFCGSGLTWLLAIL
jgi:hypothetical protein